MKGMKLEVPNKCNIGTYWVTSVVMTCGQLLRLRFDGYEEDSSADFWCDLISSEIHPIGWCAQNNQVLQPPEGAIELFEFHFLLLCLNLNSVVNRYICHTLLYIFFCFNIFLS